MAIMNKKKYLSPIAIRLNLVSEPLMLVVSGETGGTHVGGGSAGNGTPDLVSKRRGEWGHLWR